MRKIKYLLTVAALSSTMMFGCGSNDKDSADEAKEVSIDSVIEGIENADLDIKSLDFTIDANIDMSVASEDENTDIKGSGSINASLDNEAGLASLNISMTADDQTQEMEAYLDYSDLENAVVYLNQQGIWMKQSLENSAVSVDPSAISEGTNSDSIKKFVESLKDAKAEETDDYYTISGTLDTSKLFEEITDAAGDDDTMGNALSAYAGIVEELKIDVSISVNKDDYSFAKANVSIKDFEYEMMGSTLKINSIGVDIAAKNYNNVDTITIPEDAKDAISLDDMSSF